MAYPVTLLMLAILKWLKCPTHSKQTVLCYLTLTPTHRKTHLLQTNDLIIARQLCAGVTDFICQCNLWSRID